ncbi:glycan-binding surface protein [Dyadobacter sediminis]|uniref:Surface glycan-binding protein B xyloglucan binding domain-containing protein n=1 Tax=Dyadobacter sediminis TaxID=1493691 RepID=A0A5R9KCD5_9BACT|nr:glycan-binding surface protein [Dyadobacter sediminis]TLU92418.1 hypothetical protein FEM55_16995 [Dyadobacter sediminis]GGB94614.1 hypothetical protein GCM10011325_22480 [Dyadobacter sediminis]
MNLRNVYKAGFGLIAALGMLLGFQSCENKDVDGTPVINNVRLLDPAAADSSLNGALPGSLVVIQGENLQSVLKVYFNDFEATFNSALGSDKNIVIEIPAEAPTKAVKADVSNKIRVVTKGGEATYDFSLTSPEPRLDGLYSEFVKPGGTIILNGDYFYNIKNVKLGAANLEILSTSEKEIRARMPAAGSIDYITVEGEFGTAKTNFKLNDTTVYMMNFDVPVTTWGATVCYGSAPIIPATDPGAISGKYSRIKQTKLPATGYDDKWVLASCNFNFKLSAGAAEDRLFKFEHNVAEAWKAGRYEITLNAGATDYIYSFQPWNSTEYQSTGYMTNGWKTAVIELAEFKSSSGATIADVSKITDLKVSFGTPDKVIDSFNTSVDNFRIVAK